MIEDELDEELIDMYGPETGDDIVQTLTPFMNIQPAGKFQEININGKKVLIPDAATISFMESTIKTLRDKVIRLEQNLQTAEFHIRRLEGYINRTNKELNNKVSYDS